MATEETLRIFWATACLSIRKRKNFPKNSFSYYLLYGTYYMPGTVLGVLCTLTYLYSPQQPCEVATIFTLQMWKPSSKRGWVAHPGHLATSSRAGLWAQEASLWSLCLNHWLCCFREPLCCALNLWGNLALFSLEQGSLSIVHLSRRADVWNQHST